MNHLLQFVRSHDCAADAVIQDGAIYATAHFTLHGLPGSKWSRVGATMAECRRWLGY